MRIPLYVHSDVLTEPSIYPYVGYFDVFVRLCNNTLFWSRCVGTILQDAYFELAPEEQFTTFYLPQDYDDVDAFLIDGVFYRDGAPDEEIDIDDDIAMMALLARIING